jgi:GrpB-like predicted nucleotidyltransferase (UPF0157 family)
VVYYDPQWPAQFALIKQELETALKDGPSYVSIEHVGSTSVPGLAAKPILDIDIIAAKNQIQPLITTLCERAGYDSKGEWGVPGRWALRKADARPVRNLYVCEEGCLALRNHLALRDCLLRSSSAELREEYARVKREVAPRAVDVDDYSRGKSEIISRILAEAGLGREEIEEIGEVNK